VAFSAGGDGGGNPLELILDSECPNPPPDSEGKRKPRARAGSNANARLCRNARGGDGHVRQVMAVREPPAAS